MVAVPGLLPAVRLSRPVAGSMLTVATAGDELVTENVGAGAPGTTRQVSTVTAPPPLNTVRSVSVLSGVERFVATALAPSSQGRTPGVP